jgi:LuxR family transcriptional regulator, maltose regulon positive regulatory protein
MAAHHHRLAAPIGKLAVPRLGRVFERTRLFKLLDGLSAYSSIWIAAPPGAGKTTLAATWLKHAGQTVLWLQVDSGDSDAATFVRSFDALISNAAVPSIDVPVFSSDDLSDLAGCLRRRVRLLVQRIELPWTLVLDNHQELAVDSTMHHALAQALAELPEGVQWIFLSRELPPADYAGSLARQQLVVIDAEPLRFDDLETVELTHLHGRPPTAVAALAAANGWAAGMTLMLLSSSSDSTLMGSDARQRLFDYFAGEVLARMPPVEQRALGAIAHLPRASAELAIAVSGYAQAGDLLERLSAQSLFTDRREGPPSIYVFHALFSDFLRKRIELNASADEVRSLQLRAARLLVADGDIDAGLTRLIEARHWSELEALLINHAHRFVAEGRSQSLRQYIDALPAERRARLSYWRGFCALDSDPIAALIDLDNAFAACVASADVDGQLVVAAAAASALVSMGRVLQLDPWIDVLARYTDRATMVRDEDTEMRLVPGLFAALVYRQPWHPMAEALAARAERLLHLESAPGQRLLLGALAFHLLWRGHLDRLERIVLRVDALCAQGRSAPATMMRWWGVGILVKTLLGRHDSARADVEQALIMVDSEPSVAGQRSGMELGAMLIALASGDAQRGRAHMQNAALALHPDNAFDRTTYEHQRGLLALQEGDRPTALRLMRAAVSSGANSGFPMREHIALIANALAAAGSDEPIEAEQALDRVFAHPFHKICIWHHWVAGNVAAYVALRRGDERKAIEHLGLAFKVGREYGYRHGPMLFICGDMMSRLCALALNNGIETDLARDLAVQHDMEAPPEAGESWPWAVRIHVLGLLRIERSDGRLPVSRKSSRRLLELLGLLAAQGRSPISPEQIADQLWPDAEGDAARNALDNALHRLRKMLGGDDRILLRHGALSLNASRCWSDILELEVLLEQLKDAPAGRTETLMKAVLDRYREPLLPDETVSGVVNRRAQLDQQVRRTLRAADLRLRTAGHAPTVTFESLPNL